MPAAKDNPPVLDDRLWFPDPRHAVQAPGVNGFVAVGGDLSVARLLLAYQSGIFPWTIHPITWWSPDPRAIFELDRFHVSRSLARSLRKNRFQFTINRAFQQVMEGCAEVTPERESTWISPEFISAYTRLHEQGHAHSVECWLADALVGGIYGVAIGGLFAGESMFHRADDASKLALCHLIERLRCRGYLLFDVQVGNPHTEKLGAISIRREEYLSRLKLALRQPCTFFP